MQFSIFDANDHPRQIIQVPDKTGERWLIWRVDGEWVLEWDHRRADKKGESLRCRVSDGKRAAKNGSFSKFFRKKFFLNIKALKDETRRLYECLC